MLMEQYSNAHRVVRGSIIVQSFAEQRDSRTRKCRTSDAIGCLQPTRSRHATREMSALSRFHLADNWVVVGRLLLRRRNNVISNKLYARRQLDIEPSFFRVYAAEVSQLLSKERAR